jgi:methyl-accepting chemotaxis protein
MNSDAGSEIQLLDAVERDLEELTKLADQLQVKTSELSAGLNTILATADGQLSWIQETNRSTAKLEALAAELRELTSIFDLM